MLQMVRQIRVDPRLITGVAVDITASFRRDRAKFNANAVPRGRIMLQGMTISTDPSELLTTAVDGSASEAEPKVRGEVALRAIRRN